MAQIWKIYQSGYETSTLPKDLLTQLLQEIASYQQRAVELDRKCAQLSGENDELKQLCLYLDEQRLKQVALFELTFLDKHC